jgi:hypothetical protein
MAERRTGEEKLFAELSSVKFCAGKALLRGDNKLVN